jgi:D-glycero-beta-D-manno-heptose-7-phosphate kinase
MVMNKEQLRLAIQQLSSASVLVVGDVAIDEMIYGATQRISREAPVLILHHEKTNILLGAGGNAAHNLAAYGAKKTTLIGLAGKDYHCALLFEAMERDGVSTEAMIQDASRPTITKTRISGGSQQSVMQQIVRIDRESYLPISLEIEDQLVANIEALVPLYDAVIISDYNLGVVTPRVIKTCITACQKQNKILAVDSHQDLRLFKGATLATPNLPEAEKNIGYDLQSDAAVSQYGQQLRQEAGLQKLLITRGAEGMSLLEEDNKVYHIPAFNRSEVFDVTGAGDTVISALTLAMASGANACVATLLGNLAASIVVKKYGTAVTSQAEMLETLDEFDASLFTLESLNCESAGHQRTSS